MLYTSSRWQTRAINAYLVQIQPRSIKGIRLIGILDGDTVSIYIGTGFAIWRNFTIEEMLSHIDEIGLDFTLSVCPLVADPEGPWVDSEILFSFQT